MALIQLASPFDARPWANARTHNGFFFITLHTHKELEKKTINQQNQSVLCSTHDVPIVAGRKKILLIYQFNAFNVATMTVVDELRFFGNFPDANRCVRTARGNCPFTGQSVNASYRRLMTEQTFNVRHFVE